MTHPDEEISQAYHDEMNALAAALDAEFNGDRKGEDRNVCFVLLVTEFGNMAGRVNYISNGERSDIVTMLKEITARFEGQAETGGSA